VRARGCPRKACHKKKDVSSQMFKSQTDERERVRKKSNKRAGVSSVLLRGNRYSPLRVRKESEQKRNGEYPKAKIVTRPREIVRRVDKGEKLSVEARRREKGKPGDVTKPVEEF